MDIILDIKYIIIMYIPPIIPPLTIPFLLIFLVEIVLPINILTKDIPIITIGIVLSEIFEYVSINRLHP